MLIANPIYDRVFKRLMEDPNTAKFIIGTLLNRPIESIETKTQELTCIPEEEIEDEDIRRIIDLLHYCASNAEERKKIEAEHEAMYSCRKRSACCAIKCFRKSLKNIVIVQYISEVPLPPVIILLLYNVHQCE